ncbi:hypothetical protein ACWF0M_26655 [Kribbella sp. NPDC055110]
MHFDRFMFNLHPADATAPCVILGAGAYPDHKRTDGFMIACIADEQRNLRFGSTIDGSSCGPLTWQVEDSTWHLTLGANPAGVEFDLTWRARTPAWSGDITVGESTRFEHLFQSGRYGGTLTIDGAAQQVDGWYGQRDRSRGVRTMSGGHGLHLWHQAQFPDRSVGFLLVEDRSGERLLLEGAVMHTDGRLDPVVDVRHGLVFDDTLDLRSGTVAVTTKATSYTIDVDASGRGALMAGGGYGGRHGSLQGLEYDVYPLDGTVTPRTVGTSLTDRLCEFDHGGTPGIGIFEFALTRSPSYMYRPTLR